MMNTEIPSLTGLRVLAALMVFFHHYNPFSKASFFYLLVHEGYVGVTVFFVLSGFVITWNYADKLQKPEGLRRFYLFRFARIIPLYWLLLTAFYLLRWYNKGSISVSEWLPNFLLIKGLMPNLVFSGIPQSWSLTTEACFYVMAPLWIFLVAQKKWYALAGLYFLFLLGLFVFYPNETSFGSFYTIFGRFFEFGVGVYTALRLRKEKLPVFPFKTITASVAAVGMVIAYVWSISYAHLSAFYTEWILYNGLLPIVIGVGLVGLMTEQTLLRTVLSSALFQLLGKASYAFYLLHIGPVAVVLQRYVSGHFGVLLLLLWIVAYGLYRWVEKPIHHWLVAGSSKMAVKP